jgi:hypothetical protein
MSAASDAIVERLSSLRAVALFWIGFSLVFAAIQLLSSSTLTLDSAVTVENVQRHLAGGYQLRNPPLFDWLYYFASQVFGEGILAHTVLRYVFFPAIGVLHYVAFRQVGMSRTLAATFSYSLIFFVWMASDFHYHFTHSLPLLAVGLGAWVMLMAYVDRPSATRAATLGLLVGLATIAKWSFLLPVTATLVAVLLNARARAAFFDRRALLVPLFAILPLVPVTIWMLGIDGNVVSVVHDRLVGTPAPYVERILPAVKSYLVSIVLYILPWPVFVGIIAFAARRRATPGPLHPNGRLAAAATLLTIGLGLAGVIAVGVGNMGTRYMFPVLLTAPIAMAAWLAARVEEKPFATLTMRTATVMVVVATIARFWSFQIIDGVVPENPTQLTPYDTLAVELSARGLGDAQFVTDEDRDAGNLIVHLPEGRAIALVTQRVEPPPPDTEAERPCVALWGGDRARLPARPREPRVPGFVQPFIDAGAGPVEDLLIPWHKPLYGVDRVSLWRILRLPPDAPVCRMARGLDR